MYLAVSLATVLGSAGLQAQEPAPTQPATTGAALATLRTPIHTAPDDRGTAYGRWAAGGDYKVGFGDGAVFVPYLGRAYPHNQPFGWSTRSIRVGDEELGTGAATPHATDFRYELARDGITEAYDVRVDGLEQTFVLHARPAATGDLVITGTIATMLHATSTGGGHQALTFADAQGRAILSYGAATAIDARGRRLPMASRVDGDTIVLQLDGGWLAHAAFPVVVDPLLTRVTVAAAIGEVDSIDIGRDDEATAANVMIAYERAASATDGDLYVRLMDDGFANQTLVWSDVTSSWDSSDIRCAFVGSLSGSAGKWAIVFGRYFPNLASAPRELRCHVHASGDTALATNYGALIPPTNQNDWRADVGGTEAFMTGGNALVVFQREDNTANGGAFATTNDSRVFASLLDVTSALGTFGTPFQVLGDPSLDCERPSVNQVAPGGAAFSWFAACQIFNTGILGDDWDVYGFRIDNTGAVNPGYYTDVAQSQTHQLGPVVEGRDGRYLVAFTTVDQATVPGKTTITHGKEVRVQRVDWAHGAPNPTTRPSVALQQSNDRRWETTGLAADTSTNSHWVVGYRQVIVTPGSFFAAFVTRVGYQGKATETQSVTLGTAAISPVACTYDNDYQVTSCAYAVPGTNHTVYGHTFTGPVAAAPTTTGTTCSTAQLNWEGWTQHIGSEFCGPSAYGAPANSLHLMFVSLGTVDVPILDPIVYSGCRLLVDITGPDYLGVFPLAIGANVSWQLSLPEFLPETTLHFQDWMYAPAFDLFQSSHRLNVPIVK